MPVAITVLFYIAAVSLLVSANIQLIKIMSTQADLTVEVKAVTAQLQKISVESSATLQKVIDLQAIIDAGPGVSPELQAAVDELKVQAQVVDDLTPDVAPAPTV